MSQQGPQSSGPDSELGDKSPNRASTSPEQQGKISSAGHQKTTRGCRSFLRQELPLPLKAFIPKDPKEGDLKAFYNLTLTFAILLLSTIAWTMFSFQTRDLERADIIYLRVVLKNPSLNSNSPEILRYYSEGAVDTRFTPNRFRWYDDSSYPALWSLKTPFNITENNPTSNNPTSRSPFGSWDRCFADQTSKTFEGNCGFYDNEGLPSYKLWFNGSRLITELLIVICVSFMGYISLMLSNPLRSEVKRFWPQQLLLLLHIGIITFNIIICILVMEQVIVVFLPVLFQISSPRWNAGILYTPWVVPYFKERLGIPGGFFAFFPAFLSLSYVFTSYFEPLEELDDPEKQTLALTFTGYMGMDLEDNLVKEVTKGFEAHNLGVEKDWEVLAVGHKRAESGTKVAIENWMQRFGSVTIVFRTNYPKELASARDIKSFVFGNPSGIHFEKYRVAEVDEYRVAKVDKESDAFRFHVEQGWKLLAIGPEEIDCKRSDDIQEKMRFYVSKKGYVKLKFNTSVSEMHSPNNDKEESKNRRN
eukprot:CAMPEP_0114534352 /NCGR_PEP_ID=MMETSP0109-20121206/27790_1 /TAXON_ID=29199 /ORGANISM="Chlorarachnion reptans, Strain CCCM449" /LENGTH=531 /DNA_ID=CAMNT_0001717751 /DNA_START=92 /DNA_END=1687 /DNA_ORIENTATION=+